MIRTTIVRLAALLLFSCTAATAAPLDIPAPDIDAVLAADAAHAGPRPLRFAAPVAVNISPRSHGEWTTLADGARLWTLDVEARGARSLNFGFTRYRLPPGATLRLIGAGERHGAWGPEHNRRGQLWTPIVRGERATIALRLPAGSDGAELLLGQVGYGFRGFGTAEDAKSGSCNVDVVCPEGDGWRNEIRSAARITINGLFLCSGQLLNNTAEDFTPYFLTAAHCLSTEPEAIGTVFYFNYETSSCGGNPDGDLSQTVSGSTLRATSGVPSLASPDVQQDFSLVEMSRTPPAEFAVYYAGWDNRDLAPEAVVGIHHPAGDEKRISYEFDALEITAYGENPGSPLSALNPTHLKVVDWDIGTTEGGSSGSGIWNLEHRLVGQLSGGGAACGNDSPDWYGRFYQNWYLLPTPSTSVASWLDPLGSGAEVLDGADPNGLDVADEAPPAEDGSAAVKGGPATAGTAGAGAALPALLLLLAAAGLRRRRTRGA